MNQLTNQPSNPEALAMSNGQSILELPADLYIPPEAMEVYLETFEGPLDLLLYLIKKQNLDILDIPIAKVTKQYIDYVELMCSVKLELAAEYLVIAAMLAEIKSRMLLPRPELDTDEEMDPRAELVQRLLAYEQCKKAAQNLDGLTITGRDVLPTLVSITVVDKEVVWPICTLDKMMEAYQDVLLRSQLYEHHHIMMEPMTVRERMTEILDSVQSSGSVEFVKLFKVEEGRMGAVVTLLAILELVRNVAIEVVQVTSYGPVYINGAAPLAQ